MQIDPAYIPYIGFAAIAFVVMALAMLIRDLFFRRTEDPEGLAQLPAVETQPRTPIGRFDGWFDRLILESGYAITPLTGLLLGVVVGILIGGGLFLWLDDILMGVGGVLVGMMLTMAYFAYARAKHREVILEQLPEIMDFMARAVRAGESLDQVLGLVGETHREPLGVEFQRCSRQLEMGLSVDAAMRGLLRRVPVTEMRIFAATITVQRRTGGNLPITLERLARVFRDRAIYRRRFRAATAAGRTSTFLISIAVMLVVGYLIIWRPEYLRTFLQTRAGQVMLGLGIVLHVLGLFWIFRLLRPQQ